MTHLTFLFDFRLSMYLLLRINMVDDFRRRCYWPGLLLLSAGTVGQETEPREARVYVRAEVLFFRSAPARAPVGCAFTGTAPAVGQGASRG